MGRLAVRLVTSVVAAAVLFVALLGAFAWDEGVAFACINETMSETEAVKKLKAAEAALDQGDVLTARELAADVHRIYDIVAPTSPDPLVVRAARIEALAYVRDRNATSDELSRAVGYLRDWVEQKDRLPGTVPTTLTPAPDLLADYGEALERAGEASAAYDVLGPLAEKDLIGSAYAYAAFARAAKGRNDAANAELARKRCETMAVNLAACRGEYPRQPFLRGDPPDFAMLAAPFLGLGLFRLRRKRLWSAHHAPVFAAAITLFGAGAFLVANLRFGYLALALAAWVLLFTGVVQRAAWVRAVRRGEVSGLSIRVAEPDDAAPATLWFLDGPARPEVLEATTPESYRQSAKPPILFRLEQNKVSFGALVVVGLVIALFAGCAIVLR